MGRGSALGLVWFQGISQKWRRRQRVLVALQGRQGFAFWGVDSSDLTDDHRGLVVGDPGAAGTIDYEGALVRKIVNNHMLDGGGVHMKCF